MNERIRELNRQAFDAVWDLDNDPIGPSTHYTPNGFEQKFAELIVQECAQVLWNMDSGELHDEYVESLKKHFGIK